MFAAMALVTVHVASSTTATHAQPLHGTSPSGVTFTIARDSVDAGGGRMAQGDWSAMVAHAQPDAHGAMRGGAFEVTGGLIARRSAAPVGALFADGFE